MDASRKNILISLIRFSLPLRELAIEVGAIGWDADEPMVTLSVENVASVLRRQIAGELTLEEVTEWFELIEGREDIAYSSKHREILRDTIYRMANPDLHGGTNEGDILRIYRTLSCV